jgi:hypothetical protein
MPEENKKNPIFEFKSIKVGQTQKIKLNCTRPIATGNNSYGEWYLWVGEVVNTPVKAPKTLGGMSNPSYSGEVIFFPPRKLNPTLLSFTGEDHIGVEISITAEARERNGRLSKKYAITKLSDGTLLERDEDDDDELQSTSQSVNIKMTPSEEKLVNDVKALIKDNPELMDELEQKIKETIKENNA